MVAVMQKPKKTKMVGFWTDPALHARIAARAANTARGNVSAHLEKITLDDLAEDEQRPRQLSSDILADLATLYTGYLAPELTAEINTRALHQRKAIACLIEAYLAHLQAGGDPYDLLIVKPDAWFARSGNASPSLGYNATSPAASDFGVNEATARPPESQRDDLKIAQRALRAELKRKTHSTPLAPIPTDPPTAGGPATI